MYLFVPLNSHLRESDFMQNLRLDNGKKIWKALWEFKQPDVECFTAQVHFHHRTRNSSAFSYFQIRRQTTRGLLANAANVKIIFVNKDNRQKV